MLRIKKITNRRKKKQELRKAARDMLPEVCPTCGYKRATDKGLKIVCRRCGHVLLRYRDLDHTKEKKEPVEKVEESIQDPDAKGFKKMWQWLNNS